jgi:hypothetical protein
VGISLTFLTVGAKEDKEIGVTVGVEVAGRINGAAVNEVGRTVEPPVGISLRITLGLRDSRRPNRRKQ